MTLPELTNPYLVTAAIMVVVAGTGAYATDVGPWYRELKKPSWQPPDWAFGPVWTTIYCFIVASVGQVWTHSPDSAHASIAWVTGINVVANIAWSYLFFTFRRPPWALVEVPILWLSIVAMMIVFHEHRPLAAWLLTPYLAWVTVAAWLNLTIVRLNRVR